MATQYHMVRPQTRNTMGGAHLRTPQSIFQHMMGQQNAPQQAGPWLQLPQVPQLSMPWSIPALQQPDLVRFTGERDQPSYASALHQKRKLDTPDVAHNRPAKQFISEEKMAAHFQDMHISSNFGAQDPVPSTSGACQVQQACREAALCTDLEMDNVDLADLKQDGSTGRRLVISDELRRLQQEPILPASLLSKLDRPSMALVLWEPPSKQLRILSTPRNAPTPISNSQENDEDNNNNVNNNNDSIPDLNDSSNESTSSVLEPMDL